ncbi:MAG: 4-amino-4-deoxy-L-arabinose transferase [Methyloprofundus sp.]|nr:4-amino-4-deoxy-L-arabinose transferase [Methyloprofundus sp.]
MAVINRNILFTWLKTHGIALLILALATAAMFLNSPHMGNFSWSETSRNALNGVFVRDFIRDFPISDPVGYATQYYLKYPALTILFYPPLFYFLSAPFYSLFGVSHTTALIPVMLSYFALGAGTYFLCRRWFSWGVAVGGALLLMGAPEIALWSRQVMLDIPCFAFLVCAVCFLFRYLDSHKPSDIYIATLLFLCALYIKQTVIFMGMVWVTVFFLCHGRKLLSVRHIWFVSAGFVIGLIPLIIITVKFGAQNIESVLDSSNPNVASSALYEWVWYMMQFPAQLGWPVIILAIAGLLLSLLSKTNRLPKRDMIVLGIWFLTGYLFFSAIDLKGARLDIFIFLPLVIIALLPIERLISGSLKPIVSITLGISMVIITLMTQLVPKVSGYKQAVDVIADIAHKNSVVLFSGYRDGSFIFNMRAREDRHDLSILRADKILLEVKLQRKSGVIEKGYSEDEIANMLNNYGVHYIVAQSDFWTDIEQMARLQRVLRSDRFEEIMRIPTRSNYNNKDRELRIYRNLGQVAENPPEMNMCLKIIGHCISGAVGDK